MPLALQVKDGQDDLLFFVDVDMVFSRATLERIRTNTIRGRQAYFPIVFSEFDPTTVYRDQAVGVAPNHFLINQDTGYWRQYGFGIVSVYKSDLRRVRVDVRLLRTVLVQGLRLMTLYLTGRRLRHVHPRLGQGGRRPVRQVRRGDGGRQRDRVPRRRPQPGARVPYRGLRPQPGGHAAQDVQGHAR